MTEENNVEVEEKKTEGTINTINAEIPADVPVIDEQHVETTNQEPVQTATDLSQQPASNPLGPESQRTDSPPLEQEPTTADPPPPPAEPGTPVEQPVEIPNVFDETPATAETPSEQTCEQLVTRFQELARDKQEIDNGIQNLEDAQETFQDEKIKKSLEDARSLKKDVDEEIRKIMEQSFGKNCTT